jgi:hypothetical protein
MKEEKRSSFSFLVLLAASCAVACSVLDMSPLTVISWSPREEKPTDLRGMTIGVQFSRAVNTTLAEEAFSVTADGKALVGTVIWKDDRTLAFTPDEPLEDFVVYEIHVSRQAEDLNGNDLRPEFSHTFTTKTDFTRPVITSTSPADHANIVNPLIPLSVSFSEPMDVASLYSAFTLSPSANGFFSLSTDGTTLTYTPTERLQWQARYTLTIADSATDVQRNTLGAVHVTHFVVGTEATPPSVVSLQSVDQSIVLVADDPGDSVMTITPQWESTQGLVVAFSEAVLTASALSAISLSPPVRFEVLEAHSEYTTTLSFTFPDRLAYGTVYTASVGPGIQDDQGNRSIGRAAYHFQVNGLLTRPPTVTHVCFPSTPGDPLTNVELHPYDSIMLPPVAVDIDTFFDLYVSLAQGATLDPFALAESFGITTTNSAATISSYAVEANPSTTNPVPAPNEVVHRVWVHVRNNATSGQVVVHVSTGLADSRRTPLAAELVMPLNDPN